MLKKPVVTTENGAVKTKFRLAVIDIIRVETCLTKILFFAVCWKIDALCRHVMSCRVKSTSKLVILALNWCKFTNRWTDTAALHMQCINIL